MISDSCWFAFCFAYSVEKQVPEVRTDLSFSESSFHGRPPRLGWTDSGRVLLCNPGRPHSNTSTKQVFDNSIVIVDKGPRVDAGSGLICCSCHLVDSMFEKWVTTVTDVSFNFSLPWASWVYYFQETWIISCISLKANFAMPEKETTVILWNLL